MTAPALRAHILGPARVVCGERLLSDDVWTRRSARSLLLLLLATPEHRLPREHVLDTLWPEADPAAALSALYVALHALRRTLEPDLHTGRASAYVEARGGSVAIRRARPGPQGPQGERGAAGPQGPTGPQGEPGVTILNTYVWSELGLSSPLAAGYSAACRGGDQESGGRAGPRLDAKNRVATSRRRSVVVAAAANAAAPAARSRSLRWPDLLLAPWPSSRLRGGTLHRAEFRFRERRASAETRRPLRTVRTS